MACKGKCEIQITKVLNDPIVPETDTDPPGDALTPWADNHDTQKASDAVKAKIATWLGTGRSGISDCPDKVHCECHQTDGDPTDADWNTKKTLTRKFASKFKSKGRDFESHFTVEYKIAYVAGACEEPSSEVFYAAAMVEKGRALG